MKIKLHDLLTNSSCLRNIADFVVNSSIDGIRAIDLDHRYILWNPALERISGFKKEDVLGRNALELFPFLKDIGEEIFFKRALQGETVYVSERRFTIPQTGKKGFFNALHSPLYDNDGKIIGAFAIVRDVSDFKRTTMALNETELKLRNLNRVITDGLVTSNSRGEILSWNAGAATIFGYKEDEALKLNLEKILPEFPWKHELRHLRSLDHSEHNVRTMGLRKNGSGVPVEISKSRWNLGSDIFLSLGLKDLSDFTHLENQADESRELGKAILRIHNDLHQGIVAIDTHTHRIIYTNQYFASIIGYSREELMKLPETYLQALRKQLGGSIHQKEISRFFKVDLEHKNGSLVSVDAATRQIETSYGIISLFIMRNNSKTKPLGQLTVLE